jgi:hypothetical protein
MTVRTGRPPSSSSTRTVSPGRTPRISASFRDNTRPSGGKVTGLRDVSITRWRREPLARPVIAVCLI